ncbi:N-acetylmuramoyl-L-alanine amidase [Anaerotignum sp.]
MRSKWKRLLLTTVAVGMLSSVTAFAANVSMNLQYNGKNHAYNAPEISIKIDGKTMTPKDMPAVSIDGRTMLPMRQIATELGCEVVWNEAAQQVYVVNDDYTLVFTIDKNVGYQNGKEFKMDVPPMIVNDRTMLPVRALATALDLDITWVDSTRTVNIATKKATTTTPSAPTTKPETTNYVTLNKVSVPASTTAGQVFTIQANGKISDWEEVIVSNDKIVLDFYGAKSGLASSITATNSSIVSKVRTAQHTDTDTDGTIYTRVVLDLSAKKKYEVTESADGTKVIVTFDKVTVEDISCKHKNEKDVIEIEADGALGADVFTLSSPNRIVVDIPNVKSELNDTLNVKALEYVSAGRSGMFTDTTLRLVFEVGDLTEYSYSEDENGGTLTIYRSSLSHMTYNGAKDVLYLEKDTSFKTGSVKFEDHYLNGYFDVILPGDLSDVYGEGTYEIGDDVIESVEVLTKSGKTTLRFHQNRISCYSITEEKDRYVIHVKNPQDVYDKVLLLDAGHGGKDPGTSGNGLVEKNLTLTMLQKVNAELDKDIKVYLTRNSDTYPDNNSRARNANQVADAMVSIHMNAAANALVNGTETLYKNHANDTGATLTSKQLAQLIQNNIIEATGNNNRGIVHRNDLLILNGTTVPAVIVEVVFLSNAGDALKISQDAYQNIVAKAIADAIEEAFDDYNLR